MKSLLLAMVLILGLYLPCWANSSITFTWDRSPESDLKGYRLYQTDTEGEYIFGEEHAVVIVPAGVETCTLLNIPDGKYWWVLTAYDLYDNESGSSNEVTTILDTEAPAIPGFLNITVIVKIKVD